MPVHDAAVMRRALQYALDKGKPERIDYGGHTEDSHNGADQSMARDLLAQETG